MIVVLMGVTGSSKTTPDKAEAVKTIMVREFKGFGLNPMIRLEAYCCNCPVSR